MKITQKDDSDVKEYITLDEFLRIADIKKKTLDKKYKDIPGVEKICGEYLILSGTRNTCDLHRYKLDNSAKKRYVLLKMISRYKYISHLDLKIEYIQFETMLSELLSAGLICENGLSNHYGANAYDCTPLGDEVLKNDESEAKNQIAQLTASCAGTFVGAVLSELRN